ncbi:efflux RND transporter periplasmic adaptor subunit [Castellaniella sp.]|uniref:efflux RND transporter periplasmic adaptor subunit n=1 Tax=Castellaniella sp. TaxID=1955812 RepID=UPI0035637BD0
MRLLILVVLLGLSACGREAPQAPAGMKIPVSVIELQPQATQITTDLPGRVLAIEDAEIRARVTGIVKSINFDQGSVVKAGQLLFVIDPAPYQAARDQAAAQLQNAQAADLSARLLEQRYAKLIKNHAISQQDFDNAQAQARQASAAVAAAQAALDAAEIDLGYTQVTSPIDGRIGKAQVTVGALVSASSATTLAVVHRFNEVYVDITQPVSELATLRNQIARGEIRPDSQGNSRVTILLGDGQPYEHAGTLLFSGIAVDPGTGQVNLRALFPNPEETLLPGLYVRVLLDQGSDDQALVVPQQAILRTPDGNSTVVLVQDDKAAYVPVQLGPRSGGGYVVYKGLKAGDQLVVAGFQKIRPGAPVQPTPWKDPAAGSGQNDATSQPAG